LIDQENIYYNKIDNWRYRLIFKTFFGKMIMKRRGRHPDLLKYIDEKPNEVFYNRSKRAWYKLPIDKNYYLRYILEGYFNPSLNLPPWAIETNYDKIKKRTSNLEYYHSNLVYGIANGLKEKWLQKLEEGLPKADLVIVLDASQGDSFSRKKSKRDAFEKNKDFSQKISQIYRRLAKKHRWKIVNASGTKQEVHKEILKIIFKKIGS